MSPTPPINCPRSVGRPALAVAVSLFLGLILPAQQPESAPAPATAARGFEPFCVLPESYGMHPQVFVLVPGARRVGFSLVRETSLGLEPYTRSELRAQRLSWLECFLRGQETATRHLQTLEPTFHRDERKIIQYAHFQSENQLTASIFISPQFLKRFADTLGKELYIAVPDRYNVFVFPRLSNSIEKVSPKMAYLFKEALYPVSREVFELNRNGIRVVRKF